MGEGGQWKNEVWTDLCPERRIAPRIQGVRAHLWVLERREVLARGFYNRSVADDCFSGEQLTSEGHWCLNTLVFGGGYSAYRLVFGPNPAALQAGWPGYGFAFRAGHLDVGAICTAMDVANDGGRGRPQ